MEKVAEKTIKRKPRQKVKQAEVSDEPKGNVDLKDATVEELRAEIIKMKYQINDIQKAYFMVKVEVIEKDKMILDLFTKYEIL